MLTRITQIQRALRKVAKSNFILDGMTLDIGHLVVEWNLSLANKLNPTETYTRKVVYNRQADNMMIYDGVKNPSILDAKTLLVMADELGKV